MKFTFVALGWSEGISVGLFGKLDSLNLEGKGELNMLALGYRSTSTAIVYGYLQIPSSQGARRTIVYSFGD